MGTTNKLLYKLYDALDIVCKSILDDATGDPCIPKRVWPLRVRNYRNLRSLLEMIDRIKQDIDAERSYQKNKE